MNDIDRCQTMCTKWHGDRCLSTYFDFLFSISLRCSELNFVLTIPLSEGQAGEVWELSHTTMFCRISGSTGQNRPGLCQSSQNQTLYLAQMIYCRYLKLQFFGSIVLYFQVISNTPFHFPTLYTLLQKLSFRCTKDFLVNCNRLVSNFHNSCHMDTE